MDGEQLRQLATNAQLDHWPPHLGVATEADKIQYLADRLREAARDGETIDGLTDQVAALQEENDMLRSDNERLTDKLSKIREIAT